MLPRRSGARRGGELSIYSTIAICAAAALAVGWLLVSFQTPGRTRSILEWASALAMYLLLFALMASQLQRFLGAGKWLLVGSFAFLCFLFGSGFVVTGALLVREILGKKDAGTDATH
ncbi:MAG TPA: hypothetical protein VKM54_27785 [Myxococcota bacterium]|nr:hypothetical protein [Myxococcota bacterium]